MTRVWSDGQIDTTAYTSLVEGCDSFNACAIEVLVAGTCTTDINRDGDTGINDFLTLLGS